MKTRSFALVSLALAAMTTAPAEASGPEAVTGTWQVYGDKDGAPDGRVRLFLQDNKLVGVVDQLRPDVPPDSKCTKCSGENKDKPILGLKVLWGFEKDGDRWTGGSILEPQTGSTYKGKLHLATPDSLEVRGYLGVPLFGRTQTWKRVH
jgi:uncharacterized protein (DUF2147 family)